MEASSTQPPAPRRTDRGITPSTELVWIGMRKVMRMNTGGVYAQTQDPPEAGGHRPAIGTAAAYSTRHLLLQPFYEANME